MSAHEYNFDGLVGPTHNYAGLSYGNVASMKHGMTSSNPRQAALEGLEKMRFVASLGVKQAILPPHERPHLPTLRRLGYCGTDAQILETVAKDDPILLAAVCSASSMWSANAATVSASADTLDGKVHFTPANLVTQFHRSIEAETTARILRRIFNDAKRFSVHDPLPAGRHFADEGAANHTRLCGSHGEAGIELFCWGRRGFDSHHTSKKFPARQTIEASRAIARLHSLDPLATIFTQQNPDAIDTGAFHNDVVAVGYRDVLLMHEMAYIDPMQFVIDVKKRFEEVCHRPLHVIEVSSSELSMETAVAAYLFNSQLVSTADHQMILIAPIECTENASARAVCEKFLAIDNPISEIHYVDVRQSMHNGGGPACLRLRVTLTDDESAAMHQGVIFTMPLYGQLKAWITKHYREKLELSDLSDPKLLVESRDALNELTKILDLGNVYEFQAPAPSPAGRGQG